MKSASWLDSVMHFDWYKTYRWITAQIKLHSACGFTRNCIYGEQHDSTLSYWSYYVARLKMSIISKTRCMCKVSFKILLKYVRKVSARLYLYRLNPYLSIISLITYWLLSSNNTFYRSTINYWEIYYCRRNSYDCQDVITEKKVTFALLTIRCMGKVNNGLWLFKPVRCIQSAVMLSTEYTLKGVYSSPLSSGGTFTSTGQFDWDLMSW